MVDVGQVLLAGHGGGAADVLVQQGGTQHELMVHRAGDEVATHPGLGGQAMGVAGLVVGLAAGIAVGAGDDHPGAIEKAFVAGAGAADAGVGAPVIVEVVFAAQHHGLADLLGRDAVEDVGIRFRRLGDVAQFAEAGHHRAAVLKFFVALVGIQFELPAIATVVHAQRCQGAVLGLLVDTGFAAAIDTVEANAEALLVTQATAQIDVFSNITVRHVAAGQTGQRRFAGALGHQVDHPADTAVGRHAVEQGTGPLEHFNPLKELGRHVAIRGQAVQTI
ncbi:hypothetical protein D9M71_209440 [compost metagenome]